MTNFSLVGFALSRLSMYSLDGTSLRERGSPLKQARTAALSIMSWHAWHRAGLVHQTWQVQHSRAIIGTATVELSQRAYHCNSTPRMADTIAPQ